MCVRESLQALQLLTQQQSVNSQTNTVASLTGRGRPGAAFESREDLASEGVTAPEKPENPDAGESSTLKAAKIAGVFGEASAKYLAGVTANEISKSNEQNLLAQADRSLEIGKFQASRLRRQGRLLRGSQRAAAAAQGIDVESGSAADIQVDTERAIEEDAGRIREGALLEAHGYEQRADTARQAGRRAKSAGTTQALTTLISSGSQAGLFG